MTYQNQRPHKGKSLVDFPKDYTVIDIEINGNTNENVSLLEVSAIRYRDFKEVDSFSSLISQSREIDWFIKNLTGITDDMVAFAPRTEEVLYNFYDFIGNDILLGYNVNFDINFLYDYLFELCGLNLSNDFVDVLRISRKVLPKLYSHKQIVVAQHYGISTKGAHRAKVDCEICNACYLALKNDIISKYESLENFLKCFKSTPKKI